MTVNELLNQISQKLLQNNITNTEKEAEMLLSFVIRKPKEFLYTHGKRKINLWQLLKLKYFFHKRLQGYSIAAIIKEKEFYGYTFKVNKHVLIPRPETEMMIDLITNHKLLITNFIFIDVGTGTGCIPISLIEENKLKGKNDNIKFFAIDISRKALKVAKQNAKLHKIENNIRFLNGNLLEPVIDEIKDSSNLIITANLPYLTPKQIKNSPSIQKEPKLALVAGNDGLKYYCALFKQIKKLKNKKITLLCEIDSSQTKNISELIKISLPDFSFKIKKDLRGLERLVFIKNY